MGAVTHGRAPEAYPGRRVAHVPPAAQIHPSPGLPPLDPRVAELVADQGLRFTYPDDRSIRSHGLWKPPVATEPEVESALGALAEIDALMIPADRPTLLARVLTLLSHYRAESLAPQVEALVADDWATDLGEYPMWAISSAAATWRRTRKWRPQICEIRALCDDAVRAHEERRSRLRRLAEANRADVGGVRERMAEIARSCVKRLA